MDEILGGRVRDRVAGGDGSASVRILIGWWACQQLDQMLRQEEAGEWPRCRYEGNPVGRQSTDGEKCAVFHLPAFSLFIID